MLGSVRFRILHGARKFSIVGHRLPALLHLSCFSFLARIEVDNNVGYKPIKSYRRNNPIGQEFVGNEVSDSIASRRLYFANRSDWVSDPFLNWSAFHPTARSAAHVSSVSPLRTLTVICQPALRASCIASHASVNVPTWLTFNSRALHADDAAARWMRAGLVHSRSSPSTSTRSPIADNNPGQLGQSSSAKPSSILTTG